MTTRVIGLPKYYQIAEGLREQIRSGRLKPDDQISPFEALCQQYKVSRVRKAGDSSVGARWLDSA